MIITAIEAINSKRFRIYIDGEKAFLLYKGEVQRYRLMPGKQILIEEYDEILTEILMKRAIQRALYLLQSMDRTEHQIYDKLKQGEYPDSVIRKAIEYIKEYDYVNDERYAQAYVEYHKQKKSMRQLESDLIKKGIDMRIVNETLQLEENKIDESILICNWIEDRKIDMEHISRKELQKLYQFLLRKGFAHEAIIREFRLHHMQYY